MAIKQTFKAFVMSLVMAGCGEPMHAAPVSSPGPTTPARAKEASAQQAMDWYPLETGAVWKFEITKESVIRAGSQERRSSKPGTMIDRCLGAAPDDATVRVLKRHLEEDNSTFGHVVLLVELRLSVHEDRIDTLSIQQEGHERVPYDRPSPLFSFELSQQVATQHIGDLQLDVVAISQTSESVSVPAGTYAGALKRVSRGSVKGRLGRAPIRGGSVEESKWFARGVGPVKVVRTLAMDIEVDSGTAKVEEVAIHELQSYSPGVR
jgi:hypothetical protein